MHWMLVPYVPLLAAATGMRSPYQQFKNQVLSIIGVSKDAVHIYIGIGCLLVSILLLRFPPNAFRSLILGFLVSVGMEALDLRDNVNYREFTRAIATTHDLLNTNLLPFLVVLTLRLRMGPPAKRARKAKKAKAE